MASAFWYPAKGKWYGRFINEKGQHKQKPVPGQLRHRGPEPFRARGALTEKQAEEWAAQQEALAAKRRDGALPMPEENQTFDWMVSFHARTYGVHLESDRADSFYEKHLRNCALSKLWMRDIQAHHIRELLESKKGDLSPESIRKLRVRIYQLVSLAAEKGLCQVHAKRVPRPKVPKRADEYLRFDEVGPTFAQLRPDIRGLFWTTTLLGFRRQEPLWMLKADVNCEDRTVLARDTKTGDDKLLPIPAPLWPVIREALKSPGPFLFPDPAKSGGQYSLEPKFDRLLRTAMGKAGVVKGYRHVCRRKGCGFKEERPTSDEACCPRCAFRLSTYGIPRHVRFHDLRHTTGSLLAKLHVPIEVIQTILGHSDIGMTRRYLSVDMEDMRAGLAKMTDRLGLGVPEEAAAEAAVEPLPVQRVAGMSTEYALLMLSASEGPKAEARDSEFSSVESRASSVGARGFEPPTPCAQGKRPPLIRGVPEVASRRFSSHPARGAQSSGAPQTAPVSTRFAPLMLSGAEDRFLTVRQVAGLLKVSPATVYALCERGELAYSRVSNAIRVERVELEAFLDRARFAASKPGGAQ